MTECYDFHCHSRASDGALEPEALVQRARERGVTCLALTDHDTVNGIVRAQQEAMRQNIRFINGIELSVSWESHSLHIVGLNIDINEISLQQGIANLQQIRTERALKIANKLQQKRIPDAYPAVLAAAGAGMITRSHFAEFLLHQGYVKDLQEAFDRYLARGKPAYVSTTWASLTEAIAWIHSAGGVAVLAHPMRYKLSKSWFTRMLTAFKQAGGQALEVVTGRSSAEEIAYLTLQAQRYEFHASVGSDFHSPANQYVELGRLYQLPEGLTPVWQLF